MLEKTKLDVSTQDEKTGFQVMKFAPDVSTPELRKLAVQQEGIDLQYVPEYTEEASQSKAVSDGQDISVSPYGENKELFKKLPEEIKQKIGTMLNNDDNQLKM